VLPRREDLSGDRGVLIVAYASHKKKAYSFFLLQVHHSQPPAGSACVKCVADGLHRTCWCRFIQGV
jgi:hypothetical protein